MIYNPHNYQAYAIDYIETHPVASVFLDMGLGKTSITLTAISNLLFDSFEVRKVLVIAPLRVARDTWTAEVEKWDHLRNLRLSVAVGTESQRRAAFKAQADIYIINRENIGWLIEESKYARRAYSVGAFQIRATYYSLRNTPTALQHRRHAYRRRYGR